MPKKKVKRPKIPLRIGISSCFIHPDPQRNIFKGKTLLYIEKSLCQWIQSEGVLVYMIPPIFGKTKLKFTDYANDLDGLILHGGADVCPKSYDEEPLKPEWNGDLIRDQYEIALIHAFLTKKKPILGICRGLQILNVAMGGSLYQDIQTQVPGALIHRHWEVYDENAHAMTIQPNSLFSKIYPKQEKCRVNSVHHQAIKRLGKYVIPEVHCEDDNIIEAIRVNCKSFVVGVQWHPEFQNPRAGNVIDSAPLIKAFLKEARK